MVSDRRTCADLLQLAITSHEARVHTPADQRWTGVQVPGTCEVVSFDRGANLEIAATADLENGRGPLHYVVVFKHAGFLDEASIIVGEGNGRLGPVDLSLQDINRDGSLALVETSRVGTVDGHLIANGVPIPTVTNIYIWHDNAFVLSTQTCRSYISSKVLPALQKQLRDLERSGAEAPGRQKEAHAIQGSIMLVHRLLHTGHYFPVLSRG